MLDETNKCRQTATKQSRICRRKPETAKPYFLISEYVPQVCKRDEKKKSLPVEECIPRPCVNPLRSLRSHKQTVVKSCPHLFNFGVSDSTEERLNRCLTSDTDLCDFYCIRDIKHIQIKEPLLSPTLSSSSSNIHSREVLEDCEKKYVRNTCKTLLYLAEKYNLRRVLLPETLRIKFPVPEPIKEKIVHEKVGLPRPELLQSLERYVAREMKKRIPLHTRHTLEELQTKYDTILNIYKEAFNVFISRCNNLRCCLLSMKELYEQALSCRNERLKELDFVERVVRQIQFNVERDKQETRVVQLRELCTVMRGYLNLLKILDEVLDETDEHHLTQALLHKEKRLGRVRVKQEEEGRNYLLFTIRQMMDQPTEKKATEDGEKNEAKTSSNDTEEVAKLRREINRARAELGSIAGVVLNFPFLYDEVCPMSDYKTLSVQMKETNDEYNSLRSILYELKTELKQLEDEHQALEVERKQLMLRESDLTKNKIPRLNWNCFEDFIVGGMPAWNRATQGKTEKEKLDIIFKYLSKEGKEEIIFIEDDEEQFTSNSIANRRYRTRDVLIYIHDIWTSKLADNNVDPLDIYFTTYLQDLYESTDIQSEVAYNLIHSCKKYQHKYQIQLFYQVLAGTSSEKIYYSHLQDIQLLERGVEKTMAMLSITYLTASLFDEVLVTTFPWKTPDDLLDLFKAATQQLHLENLDRIDPIQLFAVNEEGLESNQLARKLCEQYLGERQKCVDEIVEQLKTILKSTYKQEVDVTQEVFDVEIVQKALLNINKRLRQEDIEVQLKWIFEDAQMVRVKSVDFNVLLEKLNNGDFRNLSKQKL